jgi:hypothetical protein
MSLNKKTTIRRLNRKVTFLTYSVVCLAVYYIIKFKKEESLNWINIVALSVVYGSSILFVQACQDEFYILFTGKFELLNIINFLKYDLIRISVFVFSIVFYFLLQRLFIRTTSNTINLSYSAIFSILLVSTAEFQLIFHTVVGLKNNIFIAFFGLCLTLLLTYYIITKFEKIENSKHKKVIEIVPYFVGVYLFYSGFRSIFYVATSLVFSTYQINVILFMMRGLFNCVIGILLILFFRAILKNINHNKTMNTGHGPSSATEFIDILKL